MEYIGNLKMASSTKKYSYPKLFEFRIKYNAGLDHSVNDSYHYFQAETADQALSFHYAMMLKRNLKSQTISVERKDPYRTIAGIPPKWIDESDVINQDQ